MQKLVFVVDDNDVCLTVAATVLEEEYRVLTMPCAEKMFSLLLKKRPDLILLDVEMPEMSGLEAAHKLKNNPEWNDIPIIFLTGRSDEDIKAEVAELGEIDIVEKPFVAKNLLDVAGKNIHKV